MTVKPVDYKRYFVGLAADIKPAFIEDSTRPLPAGSEFYALDTYTPYIFDGVSAWYAKTLLVSTS
jgi:hypothetical protein